MFLIAAYEFLYGLMHFDGDDMFFMEADDMFFYGGWWYVFVAADILCIAADDIFWDSG